MVCNLTLPLKPNKDKKKTKKKGSREVGALSLKLDNEMRAGGDNKKKKKKKRMNDYVSCLIGFLIFTLCWRLNPVELEQRRCEVDSISALGALRVS